MPEEIMLMSFTKEIVESHGFFVKENLIYHADGQIAKCVCCEEDISIDHLGQILPGSVELYCDNPICFSKFAVKLV